MIRPVLTEVGLFLIPFVVYAIYLVVTRSQLIHRGSWPLPVVGWLSAAALLLVVGSFFFLAHVSGSAPGSTYIPAHVENGQFVPATRK
jgi:uncharacterized membrane protein